MTGRKQQKNKGHAKNDAAIAPHDARPKSTSPPPATATSPSPSPGVSNSSSSNNNNNAQREYLEEKFALALESAKDAPPGLIVVHASDAVACVSNGAVAAALNSRLNSSK